MAPLPMSADEHKQADTQIQWQWQVLYGWLGGKLNAAQ